MAVTDLGLIAQTILDTVYAQLACTELGVPCEKMLAVCEPTNPCCDYLGVWIEGFGGSAEITNCEQMSDVVDVTFRVKLLRPCSVKDDCKPTVVDQLAVRSVYNDAVQFRAGLVYAMDQLQNVIGREQYYGCGVSYVVLPMEFGCDPGEQCSGIFGGLVLKLSLCDDGPCPLSAVPDPGRCGPCGDIVVPTGYVAPVDNCDASYE